MFFPTHFHTSGRFSSFHLDIPVLLVKSLMKFDMIDNNSSPTHFLFNHGPDVPKMKHNHSQ